MTSTAFRQNLDPLRDCGPLKVWSVVVTIFGDFSEVRDVVKVTVEVNGTIGPQILFDPEHNLEERIIKEQFLP